MEKFLLQSYGGPHWAHPDPVGETLAALRPAELLRLHVCSHGSTTGGYPYHWSYIHSLRDPVNDAIAFADTHDVSWPVSLSLLGMAMWLGDAPMFKKLWAHVDRVLPPEDCTLAELEDGDFICVSDLSDRMYPMHVGTNVDHDQLTFLFGGQLAVAEEVVLFLDRAYLTSALHHLELISTKVAIRALKNLDKPRHPCLTNVPRGWDMSPLQKARLLVDQQVGPFPASCPRAHSQLLPFSPNRTLLLAAD